MVVEVDLLSTELKTPDIKRVLMPNGSLMQSSVINHSAYASPRTEVVGGVSYYDN